MANIQTSFLGLDLSSPVIVGSSGLTGRIDRIKELADAGAGAVILKSLFEEQILANIARESGRGGVVYGHGDIDEFVTFYERKHSIDGYIKLIEESKKAVPIPIIASINAVSDREWQQICVDLTKAGADALQLNLFVSPFDPKSGSEELEETYYNIVRKVKSVTELPVAVKIGPHFTNIGRVVASLEEAGAQAVVLFNRYYSPDFNIKKFDLKAAAFYSNPNEYFQSLRWTALMSQTLDIPIIGATGIHDGETVIKMLLAGAHAVEVVSTIYQYGNERITDMNKEVASWMDGNSFASLSDFRGKMAKENCADPSALERVQYMKQYGDTEA